MASRSGKSNKSTKSNKSSKSARFTPDSDVGFGDLDAINDEEDTFVNGSFKGSPQQAGSFELAFPSTVYDEYIANHPISISPRDKLSFIDDKKQWKETTRYLEGNTDLSRLTRMIQTEVIRCKPNNILDFINDEFFSLENQTRLRTIFHD